MNTVAGVGGSLLRARPEYVAAIEIPLPPLEEQRRIAAILDKADAIRRKRHKAIELTEQFLKSVFLDMFGDPVTNPKGWPSIALGELVDEKRPITYGILKPGPFVPQGIIMLRIQDIQGGRVSYDDLHRVSTSLSDQYRRTLLHGGEIVVSLVGTIGLAAIVPSELKGANVHRNLAVVVPNEKIDLVYLHNYMTSDHCQFQFQQMTKGGNQGLLNLGDLRELLVPVPPRDQQATYRSLVHAHAAFNRNLCNSSSRTNALFNSLVQRAFRGELTTKSTDI